MSRTLLFKHNTKVTVDKNMRDYSKEPVFVEAVKRAEAFLKKHPLPKNFIESKESKKK